LDIPRRLRSWPGVSGSVTSGIQRDGTHKFYQRIGYDLTGLRFAKELSAKP
jgi:hypothetical protein